MFKSTKSGLLARVLGKDDYTPLSMESTEVIVNKGGNKLNFRVESDTTTHMLFVDASNNRVGVGLAAPLVPLHINGGWGAPASSGTTPTANFAITSANSYSSLYSGTYDSSPYAIWIQAQTRNDLSSNIALVLNPRGGNVGIGTSNPAHNFTVSGSAAGFLARINNTGTSSGYNGLLISSAINSNSSIAQIFTIYSQRNGGNTEEFIVTNNGNVIMNAEQWSSGGTAIGIYSVTGSQALTKSPSSRRFKTNISTEEFFNQIDTSKVYDLTPVVFNYKIDGRKSFGYIAEDVLPLLPCVVYQVPDENDPQTFIPESVNYSLICVLLVEELKKLSSKLDALQKVVNP